MVISIAVNFIALFLLIIEAALACQLAK